MENAAWIKKNIPKDSSEIIGQTLAVKKLKKFVSEKKRTKKAALVYGPSGSGKTSSVYALGRELECEILEVNASDFRNADAMNRIVGNASVQMSLLASGKIILVDELDGISGQKDRGAIPVLIKLIAKSSFPIVITLNDPFEKKFSSLRTKCEMIKFSHLSQAETFRSLSAICKKEGLSAPDSVLNSIAIRAQGDLRSGINDLQVIASGKKEITKKDVESVSDRDRVEAMSTAIARIFKTTDFKIAASAFEDVSETPDEWFLWIDENAPREYQNPEHLARAYEMISLADVFKGRISRTQYWRFLVYIKLFLTSGIALAKDQRRPDPVLYRRSDRPLKIWIAKARLSKRNGIAEKIASRTRGSFKNVVKDFTYYKQILKNSPQKEKISEELELDQKELEWLSK